MDQELDILRKHLFRHRILVFSITLFLVFITSLLIFVSRAIDSNTSLSLQIQSQNAQDKIFKNEVLAYSTSCPAACDVNSDGTFTVDDAQTFAGCTFNGCAADVNGDGSIGAADISYCVANCQDIMITPTSGPTAVPTAVATATPVPQVQPTAVPTTVYPTSKVPTKVITSSQITLRKDPNTSDYSGFCDTDKNGSITTGDLDFINKCIFDGYSYCATVDINADQKVDAGDLTAAALCTSNGQAMPNCKGADFNNNEKISQDEVTKISGCIFSKCGLIDPNKDEKTDAGDVSKCSLIANGATPIPSFSCSVCTSLKFCNQTTLATLQDCIFHPTKTQCLHKDTQGYNIWDINKDRVVNAGDLSAYSLCNSCSGVCSPVTTQNPSLIQKAVTTIGTFFSNILKIFGK